MFEHYFSRNSSMGCNCKRNIENNYIGIDKARRIAVSHAGFQESQVHFTKQKMDMEHGRYVYEIEFRKNHMEYEYEIDAKTGRILKWDKDFD